MCHIAAFGIETGQVEDHFLGIGLDGLGGLELFLRFFRIVLDGVKLAQDHAILDAFGLQLDDPFKLGDGLVENVAGGRGGRDRIGGVAQLAQVKPPQQLVGLDVVGRGLEQASGGGFGFVNVAGPEVEIGEAVVQLRGVGVGV